MKIRIASLPALALAIAAPALSAAPTLIKLADFNNSEPTYNAAPQNVNDSPVLIDGKLWFTCEKGGENGVGSLSTFDIATDAVSVALSFDNNTGYVSKSSPVPDGDLLYLTTIGSTSGSIYSNIFKFDRTGPTFNPATDILWEADSGSNPSPRSLWGGVTVIDRGAAGKDLYFNTFSGGSLSNGTIQRYETLGGVTTTVYEMPDVPGPKMPYKGFTAVGTDLYFTTFNGGEGRGALCKLDAAVRGSETVTVLAAMPMEGDDDFAELPAHNPYYRELDNCLYFTTVGYKTHAGALMKFDLATNTLSFLHKLRQDSASGDYPDGNKPYGPVAEYNKALYYTTPYGGGNVTGSKVGGTINRYDLRTGVHEVLFNLDAGTNDGFGGEVRGGCVFNGSTTEPAFYIIPKQGGKYDHGTVLRMDLDPLLPPSAYENWSAGYSELTPLTALLDADPDGDGLPNRTEFAFGTSPLSNADGNGWSAVAGENGLEIRWTARSGGDTAYTVTASPTLGQEPSPWTPVAAVPETLAVPDIAVAAGYERRRVIIPMDHASGFFRVEAAISTTALP